MSSTDSDDCTILKNKRRHIGSVKIRSHENKAPLLDRSIKMKRRYRKKFDSDDSDDSDGNIVIKRSRVRVVATIANSSIAGIGNAVSRAASVVAGLPAVAPVVSSVQSGASSLLSSAIRASGKLFG